jgi:hypothetical protein
MGAPDWARGGSAMASFAAWTAAVFGTGFVAGIVTPDYMTLTSGTAC